MRSEVGRGSCSLIKWTPGEDGGVSEQQPAVIYERTGPSGSLGIVTINRPDALGALSQPAKEELLTAALTDAAADTEVRAVLLASRGRAFCVGQDLRELQAAYASDHTPDLGDMVKRYYNPIVQTLADMPKPVRRRDQRRRRRGRLGIASGLRPALRPPAQRYSPRLSPASGWPATPGSPGASTGWSDTAKTYALMYLNERVTAEGALELGLVNAVVDDELLASSAEELALRLAEGPTAAYAAIKETLNRTPQRTSLAESLALWRPTCRRGSSASSQRPPRRRSSPSSPRSSRPSTGQ